VTGSLRARASSLAKLVELLVYPSFCHLCAEPLDEPGEKIVCRTCLAGLIPRSGPSCPLCGRFHEGAGEDHLCSRCLERTPPFSAHRSCGAYDGALRDIILLFKYRKFAPLSRPLAGYAETCLASDPRLWEGADFFVPVPLHPARRRERGFNQSRLLARDLARLRGLMVLEGCLVKARNVPPQAALRAADREKNVKNAYAVRRRRKVQGKTLILVDDVYTTGATLRECGRVLLEAGARDVRAITLAQA
jgi:competence protein ComFC